MGTARHSHAPTETPSAADASVGAMPVAHLDVTPVRVGGDDQSDYVIILEVDVPAEDGFEKFLLRLDDDGWRGLLHQLGDAGNTIAGQRLRDLAATKRSDPSLS